MKLEHAHVAWRSAMPRAEVKPLARRVSVGRPDAAKGSKTTIMAMRTKNGLVMAADRRCVGGYDLVNEDEIKIDMITDDSALASCGSLSSGQWVTDQLRVRVRHFENTTERVLSLRGQVRIASELCREAYDGGETFSYGGVFAGLDSYDKPHIYEIEENGGRIEHHRFVATGSGGPTAMAILRLLWRPGRSVKSNLELAVTALYLAGLSNIGTSDLRNTLPVLVTIEPGTMLTFLPVPTVKRLRDKVQHQLEGIR